MSRRYIGIFSVAVFVVGLSLAWAAPPVASTTTVGAGNAVLPALLPALADGEETGYSYVGSKKCKKCHLKQYKSWEKDTRMGKALETLKPGNLADAKKKFGIDVEKDYTQDTTCLECHTTGFGKPGGYFIPDPEDKKAVKNAAKLAHGGCEACHGPGSGYIKIFDEIQKSGRMYKVEELYAAGLNRMEGSVCTTACHNEKSPTFPADTPFDFEAMKQKDTHVHLELKQREE